MSRDGNNEGRAGYFKDLFGGRDREWINQAASDLRNNVANAIRGAVVTNPNTNDSSNNQRRDSNASSKSNNRRDSHSTTASTPGSRPTRSSTSTSSSSATTPDEPRGGGGGGGSDWFFQQFVGGSGPSSCAPSSSMGNSGLCGSGRRQGTVNPEAGSGNSGDLGDPNMFCDICQAKFTFFNRRKTCSECKATNFCGNCVTREAPSGRRGLAPNARTCSRCKILLSNPPVRAELMKLRVKDLQRYLISKKVNTKSCVAPKGISQQNCLFVKRSRFLQGTDDDSIENIDISEEKKDLVELVIRQHNNATSSSSAGDPRPQQQQPQSTNAASTTSTASSSDAPTRRRAPEERKKSFPNSYVQSTHRHDWLDKLESAQDNNIDLNCEEDDDFVVVTPVQPLQDDQRSEAGNENDQPAQEGGTATAPGSSSAAATPSDPPPSATEETPVEPLSRQDSNEGDRDHDSEAAKSENENSNANAENPEQVESERVAGAGALSDSATAKEKAKKEEPHKADLNVPMPSDDASSPHSSPRRFANQGLVRLSEIETIEEIQDLSVKQAIDILAMNRVNFKGVVEKGELLKFVTRLWKQERQAQTEKDNMDDAELCKICMDNPVDCVMLECGHYCTCTTCGKQLAECPICRQYVVRVVRTFKA